MLGVIFAVNSSSMLTAKNVSWKITEHFED